MIATTKVLAAVVALGLGLLAPSAARAQVTAPPGFEVETVVDGYSQPVASAYAPDGRIFTVQKRGRVHVARADGSLPPTQVLDISGHVNTEGDRGLLGIALDRDFSTNGFAYLVYTYELNPMVPDAEGPSVSRLVRIKINPDNTVANPSSPETILLGTYSSGPCPAPSNTVDCIPADYHWHTIGTVLVDPVDGTLWLGSGDSTVDTTQQQAFRTYDEQSMSGKIMHVDREGRGLPGHPFCPAETDLTKVCAKLYAKGFRNPFRFTLRPGKGPIVGDVGHTQQEEIDLLKPGRNYGWPCYQGTGRPAGYSQDPKCQALYALEKTPDAATPPDYAYPHDGNEGASVTVGPQYSGTAYPAEYRGDIFFGDYVRGWIKRLKVDANDVVTGVEPFAEGLPFFVELAQDPSGRLAFVDLGGFQNGAGAIRRFDLAGDLTPTARATADRTAGPPPLTVAFTGSESSDPEGATLTYDWDFGDGTAHSAAANPSHTYAAAGTYTAELTVTDPAGNADSDTVEITAGAAGAPPVAQITAPVTESAYVTGEAVTLRGSGTDPEDGALPGTALSWQVVLHHNTHVHEQGEAAGPEASFTTDAGHDADVHYEIRLTVTDSSGRTDQDVVLIRPKTVKLTLNSSPPGAPVIYAGHTEQAAPLSVQAATGFRGSVAAAAAFEHEGRTYRFQSWSDGGARSHDRAVPAADTALVARYRPDGAETVRVTPRADTTVSSASPASPRGASAELGVDASPAEQALLRFDVTGVAGRRVLGTRLALFGQDTSGGGPRVFRTATDAWTEDATWETRPALAPTQLGAFGGVRAAEWFEAPLAAGSVTGDGALSLGLDSVSSDGADYSSRESAAKPHLVVEVDPRRPRGASSPAAKADFDGDGREDLAVAVPEEDAAAGTDTGGVHVLYGATSGLGQRSQFWTQNSYGIADAAEAGDAFGASLAAGDFDGDGRDDLAIGAPGEDLGSVADAGVVHVLRGSAGGLSATGNRLWSQASAGIVDGPGARDGFGSVLAAGDATGDGRADLAVGVPWEDLGTRRDAGAVHLLPGGADGLAAAGSQQWTQDSAGVADGAGAGDELGGALAFGDVDGDGKTDLAMAAPLEDVGPAADAGVVHVLHGASAGLTDVGSALLSENTAGVAGAPETGDRFGSALAAGRFRGFAPSDLAIGAPGEDAGAARDTGAVHVLRGATGEGSVRLTQDSAGVADVAQAGDGFGAALAAGRVAGGAYQSLAIGVPDEDLGAGLEDAGVVHVLPGSSGGVTASGSRLWSQATAGIADAPAARDRFGTSIAALNLTGSAEDDLVVGAPGESVGATLGAGLLHVVPGTSGGLAATGSSTWAQGSPSVGGAPEPGDGFGGALGG